jgi:serine/threonine protein kinase
VSCHGYSNKDGFVLVKEYMNMGTLKDWMKVTPLSRVMPHIPKIALDIARAMDHIHTKGYSWGNLNSSNVLVSLLNNIQLLIIPSYVDI